MPPGQSIFQSVKAKGQGVLSSCLQRVLHIPGKAVFAWSGIPLSIYLESITILCRSASGKQQRRPARPHGRLSAPQERVLMRIMLFQMPKFRPKGVDRNAERLTF